MSEALDILVMRKVITRLGNQLNYLTVWLDRSYGELMKKKLDDQQIEVNKLKEWAKTVEDKATRRSYIGWIDYYQNGLDSAYRELRTQAEKKSHEKYDAERQLERDQIEEYERTHTIPEPPR